MACIEVEGSEIMMEVDTGASVSLVSERTYNKYWPNKRLEKSAVTLRTYSKEKLRILGSMTVCKVQRTKTQATTTNSSWRWVKFAGTQLVGTN